MTMKRFLTLPLICILYLAASALPCAAETPFSLPAPDHIHYPPLRFEIPEPSRLVLENGIILYHMENRELPLVHVSTVIRTGSVFDPEGKEGLAELTADVMRIGGAASRTGDAIDETIESLAGILQVSANRESCSASLSVLRQDLQQGLEIFSDILRYPSFEATKLLFAKKLKIEGIRRLRDDPQKLAFREFNRLFFEGDPRGRYPTPLSIDALTRDDLIRFHQRYFHPANIMMAITGDISHSEAVELAMRYFGTWISSSVAVQAPQPKADLQSGTFFLLKDIPQSIIINGCFAPSKKETSFYAFEMIDFLAGSGGFRSRIFQQVRTDEGLAYSTGSFYRARPDYGLFGTYVITKSDSTLRALDLVDSIIGDFAARPVSIDELTSAKKAMENRFIFSFESAEKIVSQHLSVLYDDLPADFLKTYRGRIEKLRADDLLAVARRYLHNSRHSLTLVLGNETVLESLRKKRPNVKIVQLPFEE